MLDEDNGTIPRLLFFVRVSKHALLGNWYNDALGGVRRVVLETEQKKHTKQSPKTAKLNKSLPKPKTEVKAPTDKALVGFRISLSVI